ncbi:eotaxin-like [Discoglossus pictus]
MSSTLLLLGVTLLSSQLFCYGQKHFDYRRPIKVSITCCAGVTRAKIPYTIISYKKQPVSGDCVNAVIFQTDSKGSFCSDPKAKWVRIKMKELDNGGEKLPKRKKQGRVQKKIKKKAKIAVTVPWLPSKQT